MHTFLQMYWKNTSQNSLTAFRPIAITQIVFWFVIVESENRSYTVKKTHFYSLRKFSFSFSFILYSVTMMENEPSWSILAADGEGSFLRIYWLEYLIISLRHVSGPAMVTPFLNILLTEKRAYVAKAITVTFKSSVHFINNI